MTTRSTRGPRRRTVVALAIVLTVLVVFVMRLVDIQVVNAKTNVDQSLAYGLGVKEKLTGTRGTIVDSQGVVLASSTVVYDCQLSPMNVGPVKRLGADGKAVKTPWNTIADKIAKITGQTGDQVRALVADALKVNAKSQYALLGRGYTTDQYRALMELGTGFIACTSQPSRTYPNGAVAGNLLGFMSSGGQAQAGLELADNSCLSPTDGSLSFQQGKSGITIPGTETEKPAVNGGTLTLTIDSNLQWYMEQAIAQGVQTMQAKAGEIMVVDVKTGQVKAAAEYPTVDPNDINASSPDAWYSKIFTGQFEPGSTFKGLLASMLIDDAGQTPLSTVDVPDKKRFPNGAVVSDSESHGVLNYTLAGVLIDSSNVGASTFSERIDPNVRYAYYKKFGIGDGSAISFPGQTKGVIHPVKSWDNQMLYDTSYGQGLTTTLPELVEAYDAIANDGVRVPLSLVASCTKADGTVVAAKQTPIRVMKASTSAQVREIMENVALQASNYSNLVKIPGYRVAVKSGTGQIASNGSYLPDVYYTTMIGFAPADNPQYLVAVTLDQPTKVRSSPANAPTWTAAMTQVLKTYRVLPSTTQPTILPRLG
jgi:cell division protein FtsI (penicillin-binding protein 3)